MNTKLVEWGILKEDSDYRIHVCISSARVYVFRTSRGKQVVDDAKLGKRKYNLLSIRTGEIITAQGYTVPCDDLLPQHYPIPDDLFENYAISKFEPTSVKGAKATRIVSEMIGRGIILLPVKVREVDDMKAQISGIDLSVNSNVKIQVKCDFLGGHKQYRGTGNLFLQTAECNPWGQH